MLTGMLSSAYGLTTNLAAPLIGAGLACSARGRRRFKERFGSWKPVPRSEWWLHGASVGEVQGLLPLIAKIRASAPSNQILLTSTSPTGLDRGAALVDHQRLLPIDVGWCVRRALRVAAVDRLILSETELWPTFIAEALKRGVPIHIVNGRISDYTLHWYKRLKPIFEPLLNQMQSISVVDELQYARYIELGVDPKRVHVTGHTKYDVEPRVSSERRREEIRAEFFPGLNRDALVVVLGSIRPGEEHGWLSELRAVLTSGRLIKMIVAPRHMEKLPYFIDVLRQSGMSWRLWSESAASQVDLVLLDTMGRLEDVYSIANLAFIGGTLVDIGGHNPLEAAMYGVPVVVGPYTSVISEVVKQMRDNSGIIEIANGDGITHVISRALDQARNLDEIGARGREIWLSHRGSVKRVLSVIADV